MGAAEVLELARQATDAYGRPDLGARVERVAERVTDPTVRVLVVGEFKQGKSSLVNGLVNAPVCPVDDDVATSVPTAVRWAARPEAVAVWAAEQPTAQAGRQKIELADVAALVSEQGNPGNERNLASVEIGLPRELLRSGLVLVDTPGVGGLGSTHSAATVAALPSADAVLLVSDASQELTAPELEFLHMARDLCPTLACVVTKTDFHAHWRAIVELDAAHLAGRDLSMPVFPTSAALRTASARRRAGRTDQTDQTSRTDEAGASRADAGAQLQDESGYPPLVSFLHGKVAGDAAGLAARSAAHAVVTVADELALRFRAEREVLVDPAQAEGLLDELTAAQQRAADLRSQAARWQQTLADGIADLSADADHDLRGRLRQITARIDDAITDVDPGDVWEELEQWVYRMVNAAVAASYAMMTARAQELAERVGEHFAEGARSTERVGVTMPVERLRAVGAIGTVDSGRSTIANKGLTAMRGSYGGVMMTGIIGSMLGFGLFNPVSLSFGVLLGRKAIKDERERAVTMRRQQTRQVCRSYVDSVGFAVGKDARDGLRRMQRLLRDQFTEQADALQRTSAEAIESAKAAVRTDRAQRDAEVRRIDAELERLRRLRTAALALDPATARLGA